MHYVDLMKVHCWTNNTLYNISLAILQYSIRVTDILCKTSHLEEHSLDWHVTCEINDHNHHTLPYLQMSRDVYMNI